MKIEVGPAGTGGGGEQGFIDIKNQGLEAVEVAFTYGVWMKPEQARKIAELNKKLKLKISIHAPYYINLNSKEKAKIEASKKRILKCCEIGDLLGAKEIVFHPGFYQKMDKEETYQNIKKQIQALQKTIKEKKYNVELCPETTGKESQFGSLKELLRLKKETKCSITIDFSHLKARSIGKLSYTEAVNKIKSLRNIHAHFSGIEWTDKGEKRHLPLELKDVKELLQALKKNNVSAKIINEGPDTIKDALLIKNTWNKIK